MTIAKLRETRALAIGKLNSEEAIHNETLYKEIENEIADLDAKIERANRATALAAELARPAAAQAAADSQQDAEGYGARVEGVAQSRALERGVMHPMQAYDTERLSFSRRFERALAKVRVDQGFRPDASKHFRGLGEFLQSVAVHYHSRGVTTDARLVRAPTGAGEVDPTGGGFLVQTDFAQAIFMLAHEMGEVLAQVNKLPIGDKFNGIKIPGVDETSRATGSRWGGVQSYWTDEGTATANTKPKFRMIEFSLHKLMSLMYTSDELLQDASALGQIAAQAFAEEIMFMTEDSIFEGNGAGQPLGILPGANNPTAPTGALLSTLSTYGSLTDPGSFTGPTLIVPKETSQKAGTVIKANIDKMWGRCWARSRQNAVWLINQDVEPQLFALNQPATDAAGNAYGGAPVYMPPGGMNDSPYAKLYGRPVIATEYNPGLGRPGDIVLADLSQYTLVDKGGVQAAMSMHVAFLTDQQVFRITYRVDGRPMWTVPMAPFAAAGLYKSPFAILGAR